MGRTLRNGRMQASTAPDESKLNGEQKKQYDKIKNMAEQYKGKNENEILEELNKTVKKGKSDGSITDEKLNNIATTIAPMLSGEQRKKLEMLMNTLRR